jgi:hypothetical protein
LHFYLDYAHYLSHSGTDCLAHAGSFYLAEPLTNCSTDGGASASCVAYER